MKYSIYLIFCLILFTETVLAQSQGHSKVEEAEPAIVLGEKHKITSSILGEERPFTVYLPESYNNNHTYSTRTYPILYLLAGNELLVKAITQEMSRNSVNKIPELIIVSVPVLNSRKYHNYFTPTNSHTLPDGRELPGFLAETGKGEDFMSFLGNELLPHIDSTYRTLPYRILNGHSLAGLFTLNASLAPTDLFQAYLAIDPSLWWDGEVLVERLEQNIKDGNFPEGNIYIALASRQGEGSSRDNMDKPIINFSNQLKSTGTEDLHFRLQEFPEEHHGSVPMLALYNGFQHIFEGYEPAPDQFSQRPETILPHFKKVSKRLGIDLLPPESLLDQTGNWLIFDATTTAETDQDKLQKGLEVLKINLETYPDSYHAHQALADAYMAMGNEEMARKYYERSLDLNPQNEYVQDRLENLEP
jgi:predicted alpha/beta superfamily hydrolase